MKAIVLKGFGGVENLELTDLPVPVIQPGEVLVQPASISINPVDVKTRLGKGIAATIKDELPALIGWDISGIITSTGSGVTDLKVGDEVFAMLAFPKPGKTYAAYVVAAADQLALKPPNISHDEAAAATLAALTAWQALTFYGHIKEGDKVLIHAAAGGVGHYAVQMAKYLGAHVTGTSSAANKEFVLSLGADEHVDYKDKPFEKVVKDMDYVLDTIGGEIIDRSLTVTKRGGTVISIVTGANAHLAEKAAALGITGTTFRVHPSGGDMRAIADLLQNGTIRSHIFRVFPFEEMADAHRQIESGHTVGKIVLRM